MSRLASHSGSWYSSDATILSTQLDTFLARVPDTIEELGRLPPPLARMIIAPHAGYDYSGATAAWAYKAADFKQAKRIFLLGPSHHKYLESCALSSCHEYVTPLGSLAIDQTATASLRATGRFEDMSKRTDEREHSLEMHLPYIYTMLSKIHPSPASFPRLVPILVGNTSPPAEKEYGALLARYLADSENVFIISSDFCHWGARFGYTFYLPKADLSAGYKLRGMPPPEALKIYESIEAMDQLTMRAIEAGSHDEFTRILHESGNTVCGRHPIGIALCALQSLKDEKLSSGNFKFLHYTRNQDVEHVDDSSVSYASGICVLEE